MGLLALFSGLPLATALAAGFAAWLLYAVNAAIYNLFFHPLSHFPGPRAAAVSIYWKAFVECILQKSFCHVVEQLHATYGEVVRVGPDELHFANPRAYHDIYNNKNRWDKEPRLYHSFNEDRSSFGFLTYTEAKERKDVLTRSFSPSAIEQAEGLIVDKIKALCAAFAREGRAGKPVDLFWAYRCMTMDIITFFCFGKSVDAINAPQFHAPIIEAMDASLPVFVWFKHSDIYKNMILKCPPKISKIISPPTRGLVDLQQILLAQINDLSENPESLKHLPHQMTIYHRLLNPEAYRTNTVPSAGSLYEEAQALMFAGADTTGNTLMIATYHLLKRPETLKKLKAELGKVWKTIKTEEPTLRELEKLPYMNAAIKESLRLNSGVVSGLPRIIPEGGATISGVAVPESTIVSCGSTFVHSSSELFPEPDSFIPERWLENPDLDNWLVPFSRGPRSCLGINLAWAELRLTFAHVFHKFDMTLTDPIPTAMPFRDTFLPFYYGPHLLATLKPVSS